MPYEKRAAARRFARWVWHFCAMPYTQSRTKPTIPGPQLARLLSCPLIWLPDFRSFRHLHLSFIASTRPLFDSSRRAFAKWFRSDTPCIPPCSSTGCWDRSFAVLAPSRHMSLSDLRGSITGTPARSACCGHRQDIMLPAFRFASFHCRLRGPHQFVAPPSPRLSPTITQRHSIRYSPNSNLTEWA